MTRVLITGCRYWVCPALATIVLKSLVERHGADLVIVHGAANGVDSSFAEAAAKLGITHEPHPAAWKTLGRSAGPKRNAEMVARGAAFAIAVHRSLLTSRGTLDCVRQCLAAGIPVWLIDGDDAKPRRITSVD